MHKLIVANYKMNGDKDFYSSVKEKLNSIKVSDAEVILCPPFVYLPFLETNKNYKIGTQNITAKINKKSTGEISPTMLKEFGVDYVIIGHSERRVDYDTEDLIANKVAIAVENGLIPIICVGEKNKGDDISFIPNQIKSALSKVSSDQLIIAYEPIWAIGTGIIPTNEDVNEAVKLIKQTMDELKIAVQILYGGSVNGNNYKELLKSNVDGFLCGTVTLNTDEFIDLIMGVDSE